MEVVFKISPAKQCIIVCWDYFSLYIPPTKWSLGSHHNQKHAIVKKKVADEGNYIQYEYYSTSVSWMHLPDAWLMKFTLPDHKRKENIYKNKKYKKELKKLSGL